VIVVNFTGSSSFSPDRAPGRGSSTWSETRRPQSCWTEAADWIYRRPSTIRRHRPATRHMD